MALTAPPRKPSNIHLGQVSLDPGRLIRISNHTTGEPYFGRSGANRFDDYRKPISKRFGTCYFGLSLSVAFAETVLHDEVAVDGKFKIAEDLLETRQVVSFSGTDLILANMTGVALKRAGADGSLSTIMPYALPQKWSVALHAHPYSIDGFVYVSRHLNNGYAVVLFDRAAAKLAPVNYTPLPDYPGALRAAMAFGLDLS
ncbi:MAG: RES family NAD+ phosphorylase [Thiobacillaceae bacterium]